jgi:hypothetical protein
VTDRPSPSRIARALLDRHGRTYAAEAGIDLSRGTPSPLFRLLCLALLLSARIRADTAVQAARAVADAGWRTPRAMRDATWEERTRVLNRSGYARYDERTSRMLGDAATLLLAQYDGDLRRLRERAGRDPDRERSLLTEFPGIGDLGAAIFAREVQAVWPELDPFADDRALDVADALGLGRDVQDLRRLVDDAPDFARLVAALVRCGLARDAEGVLDAARDEQQRPSPAKRRRETRRRP